MNSLQSHLFSNECSRTEGGQERGNGGRIREEAAEQDKEGEEGRGRTVNEEEGRALCVKLLVSRTVVSAPAPPLTLHYADPHDAESDRAGRR